MAEWLRRLTRNQMGYARTGSNPVHDEFIFSVFFCNLYFLCFILLMVLFNSYLFHFSSTGIHASIGAMCNF